MEELIRDLTQVAPRSKSEVRKMLLKFREDTLREGKEELKQIMNRCKTEKGLAVAISRLINKQVTKNR